MKENEIILNKEDILNIPDIQIYLAENIANKIVEKNLYDKEQDEDTYEIYTILKDKIKKEIEDRVREIIKEQLEILLKNEWSIKNMLEQGVKEYINRVLQNTSLSTKQRDF